MKMSCRQIDFQGGSSVIVIGAQDLILELFEQKRNWIPNLHLLNTHMRVEYILKDIN